MKKKNVTVWVVDFIEEKEKKKKNQKQLKLNRCSILATDANGTTQLWLSFLLSTILL